MRRTRPFFLAALVCALCAFLLSHFAIQGHGVFATHGERPQRVELIAFVTANDGLNALDSLPAHFQGYLYLPQAQRLIFRQPTQLTSRFLVDQQLIFERETQPLTTTFSSTDEGFALQLAAGFHQIQLDFQQPGDPSHYFEAGLQWRTRWGWQLIPARYLFPNPVSRVVADRSLWLAASAKALLAIAGVLLIFGCTLGLRQRRPLFPSSTNVGLLILFGVALLIRLLVLRQLGNHLSLDFMPLGSDQRGYYQAPALDFVRGVWPGTTGAFFAKPGYTFWIGLCYSLFDPFLTNARLVQMILGAGLIFPLFYLAQHFFDKTTAWCAVLLWLLFPYAIFYEAQILTHAIEPLITVAILLCWSKILAHKDGWRWFIISGMVLGLAAIVRPSFLVAAPLIVLTMLWQRPSQWFALFGRAALLAVATLITISPVTLHNYLYGGVLQLISTEGPVTLYMGNHRDSSGYEWKQGPDAAFAATIQLVAQGKTDYRSELIKDIVNDPNRFGRLLMRKGALLFSDVEMSNNVDFFQEGTALSPTLARLPLRIGIVMALALSGFLLAWPEWRSSNWGVRLLLLYFVANCLLNIAFLVLSRMLAPLYPVLILLAAWTIATMVRQIRQHRWRSLAVSLILVLVFRLGSNYAIVFADAVMPLPSLQALPEQAKPLNSTLTDSLTLVGYQLPPVAEPGVPIFVNLFWQINRPLEQDLMGSVQLLNVKGDEKLVQADHRLGEATFPKYQSSQWQPGEIVRDQYLLRLPTDLPIPVTLPLLVIAYQYENDERLGSAQIGPMAISLDLPPTVPPDAILVNARIGSATLLAYQVTKNNHQLDLTFYWRATGPILEDGVIFVHLLDDRQQQIAGDDQRPRNGTYATIGWQPNEGIVDQRKMLLPPDLGDGPLTLALGMYAASTQERLPVWNAEGNELPDRMVLLGPLP